MTEQFKPSKWGHTLDDANMTMLVEPMPGTQVIYEYIDDCSKYGTWGHLTKVFPPNTTLIVHNFCPLTLTIVGEVTKLVVEYNSNVGEIVLGSGRNSVLTQEVVIRSNDGYVGLLNTVKSLEVQNNTFYMDIWGDVTEHIDLKNNTRSS